MKNIVLLMSVLALLSFIPACSTLPGTGLLYTHPVQPLTRHRWPVDVTQNDSAQGDRKEIQFQYVTVVWDYNAIGEIAKKGGIKTIHYADLETRSVFFGIWGRSIVHIYGTAE